MEEVAFSEAFLKANQEWLDAIGQWEYEEYEDGIIWREPEALRNRWVPCDLRFWTEVEGADGTFDPDDQMFALWERYLPRHPSVMARFQREAEETFADDRDEPFGKRAVTRASVVIRRGGEPDDPYHALELHFSVPADEDHGYSAEYDEEADDFTEFSCS